MGASTAQVEKKTKKVRTTDDGIVIETCGDVLVIT